jgi:hypothetical protein
MHAIATQAHLTLEGVLAWRQHHRSQPCHRLPFSSPSGTLDMGVVSQNIRIAVLPTTLTVLPGSATEQGHPPLHGTPTGITPLRCISVMGLTKHSRQWRVSDGSCTRWRSMCEFRRNYARPSTPMSMLSTTSLVTLVSILMLKSCKDLSLREESGCAGMSGCSFHSISSLSN